MPETQLESIFEPFYRGVDGCNSSGYGLGLAIVRRALSAHGGAINARNQPTGGLLVNLVLPKNFKQQHGPIGNDDLVS